MYNQYPRQLAFRSFLYEVQNDKVFVQGASGHVIPAYEVQKSRTSKSQIQIARLGGTHGWGPRRFDIGAIKLHTYSSKVDVSLHGAYTTMRLNSTLSSSHNFDWAPYGHLQWKQNFTGSEMQLYDDSGRLLATARIKSKACNIEVLVPGDEFFVDMIVSTAVAKIRQSRKEIKDASTGSDIVSAIVGA